MTTENLQEVVILSPCVFTRQGLEGVVDTLPTPLVCRSLSELPGAFGVLWACTPQDVLVLHVTALVADADWWRFDTVLSLRELQCHTLLLVDAESEATLARMSTLTARADRIASSAVPRRELMTYLAAVITDRTLCA